MKKIPMLERFAAQSLVEYEGELIFSKEKFAELIVAECISTLDQDDGATHHGELLREHFGVEEQVNDSKELHTCPYREEIHYDYESLCDCDEQQQHQCLMDI